MATPKSKSGSKPAAKSAKSSNGNGKSAAPAATEGTSLADICKELKMEPRAARRKLRNAEFEAEGGRYVFTRKADVEKVKKILAGGE